MKQKIITIIFGMILLIGIVGAEPTLSNADTTIQNIPLEVIAGDTFQGDFSFDYFSIPDNEDNLPLIIRLDVISDDTAYPVGKDEFEVGGYVDKCTWTILGVCILPTTVYFDCSEETPLTIEHAIGIETINNIPEGTFYCYDEGADLKLDEHNTVFLNIKSHPALYPGTYNLIASIYYLTDTYAPIVTILNKDNFENVYYNSGKYVEVIAEIKDLNLYNYKAKIITPTKNYSFYKELIGDDKYRFFFQELPNEIPEGNHTIEIFAQDIFGNNATDETRLLIDETPPEIVLVEPVGGIYSEIIPIEFNVIDEKAGVDNESVQVRLREIKEGIGLCPEAGGPINGTGCVTTSWINLTLSSTSSSLFEVNVNTTYYNLTSGEYWLDAVASDILGNKAEWIA